MISNARVAANHFQHMETKTGDIARMLATSHIALIKGIPEMDDRYRANLESYLASMLQAKRMLTKGIITPGDFARVDAIMAEKYEIPTNSLYRG